MAYLHFKSKTHLYLTDYLDLNGRLEDNKEFLRPTFHSQLSLHPGWTRGPYRPAEHVYITSPAADNVANRIRKLAQGSASYWVFWASIVEHLGIKLLDPNKWKVPERPSYIYLKEAPAVWFGGLRRRHAWSHVTQDTTGCNLPGFFIEERLHGNLNGSIHGTVLET